MGDNSDTPSYLGLLNAIAVGEARGRQLLEAWAQTTRATDLKQLLALVAIRAQEHAASFTKRLCELGYAVHASPAGDLDKRLEIMRSDASDRAKFDCLFDFGKRRLAAGETSRGAAGESDRGDSDMLSTIFQDKSIDIETGALLGRFIAEERDSERRLRACYAELRETPADDTLNEICARLERLTRTIEELKAIRGR